MWQWVCRADEEDDGVDGVDTRPKQVCKTRKATKRKAGTLEAGDGSLFPHITARPKPSLPARGAEVREPAQLLTLSYYQDQKLGDCSLNSSYLTQTSEYCLRHRCLSTAASDRGREEAPLCPCALRFPPTRVS